MDLTKIGYKGMDWIHLTPDRFQWHSFSCCMKSWSFLASNSSMMTLYHGVICSHPYFIHSPVTNDQCLNITDMYVLSYCILQWKLKNEPCLHDSIYTDTSRLYKTYLSACNKTILYNYLELIRFTSNLKVFITCYLPYNCFVTYPDPLFLIVLSPSLK